MSTDPTPSQSLSTTTTFPLSSRKIGSIGSNLSLSPPPALPYWYRATDVPKYHPKPYQKSTTTTNATTTTTSATTTTSKTHASTLPLSSSTTNSTLSSSSMQPHSSSTTTPATISLSSAMIDSSITTTTTNSSSNTSTTTGSSSVLSPSVWVQFSSDEATKLELLYQQLHTPSSSPTTSSSFSRGSPISNNTLSFDGPSSNSTATTPFVPYLTLGEDQLLEVDVEKMIVYPIYWPGPIYEVRRSIWYCLGSGTKWIPCDPSLNRQLEEGYLKIQPWLYKQSSLDFNQSKYDIPEHKQPLFGMYLGKFVVYTSATTAWVMEDSVSAKIQQAVFVTFTSGVHLGGQKVIRGYDHLPPVMKDREAKEKELQLSSTNLASASTTSSTTSSSQTKSHELNQSSSSQNLDPHGIKSQESIGSSKTTSLTSMTSTLSLGKNSNEETKETNSNNSSTNSANGSSSSSNTEQKKHDQVDHLLLVIHGIGAKLSEFMESVNFITDVANLRKGIQQALLNKEDSKLKNKNIFVLPIQWRQAVQFAVEAMDVDEHDQPHDNATERNFEIISEDLEGKLSHQDRLSPHYEKETLSQEDVKRSTENHLRQRKNRDHFFALSPEPEPSPSEINSTSSSSSLNGHPGVLPDASTKSNTSKPLDSLPLSSSSPSCSEYNKLPSLDEIMLQGVPTIRTLVTDVVLDVLLFMTPKYKKHIISCVTRELNRVYYLFLSRHPTFQGTVSLFGHSLGSVISMEIVSELPYVPNFSRPTSPLQARIPHVDRCCPPSSSSSSSLLNSSTEFHPPLDELIFEVDHLFCVGSPLGYFLLLQGERLRPRFQPHQTSSISIKRPNVKHLYNLFSQYDPVAVRMEPLISRELVPIAPYLLPYQKGGLKALQQGVENVTLKAMGAIKMSSGYLTSIFKPLTQFSLDRMSFSSSSSQETSIDNRKSNESLSLNGIRLLNPRYGRVDFALQQGLLENPYLAALSIHMCYWSDIDIAHFVAGELVSEPISNSNFNLFKA